MNEKDILLLQGLGYTVNEYGAILDNNGNYLENVVYKGKVIKSYQTKGEFIALQKRKSKLREIGFKENNNSSNNLYTQEEIALAKNHIAEYYKDTTSVSNPYLIENPYYQAAFKEIELENTQSKTDLKVSVNKEKTIDQIEKDSNDFVIPVSLTLLLVLISFVFIKYFRKSKSFLYYSVVIVFSITLSTYLGFKNKELTDLYYLQKASMKKSEWQKDAYLDYVKSQDSFFEISGYDFNWEWFFFTFLVVILIAITIRNTIYYDRIKSFIKSIRR